MGRHRQRRREPPQSSPDPQKKFIYKSPGVVKLLFETPSGFAIFSLDESYLEKDIEHIWTYFIGDFWYNNVIWLDEFHMFEDRPNAINCATRQINSRLIKMIVKHTIFGEKLVVGRPEYKEIIEESLDIPCLYNDAVKEVMWGMQNLLRTVVPEEQSEMPMEDRIPMSKGLDMVLRRNGLVVEPKLINEAIIRIANAIYDIDLHERAHSKFLHQLLGGEFMAISGLDIEDWSLLKLATAIKKMCYFYEGTLVGNPYEMFSVRELEVIENDAAKYRDKVDENLILKTYNDVVALHEDKINARYKLICLVQEAKEAVEAEDFLEEPATTGVNSKQQVGHTCLTVDPPAVPNQSIIGEEQLFITDAGAGPEEHEKSAYSAYGGEMLGNIFNDEDTDVEGYEKSAYRENMQKTKDKDTNVEETGATPGGDGVGKVLEKDQNSSVKLIGSTSDGYNVRKNTKNKDDIIVGNTGATPGADVGGKAVGKESLGAKGTTPGGDIGGKTQDRVGVSAPYNKPGTSSPQAKLIRTGSKRGRKLFSCFH